MERQPLALTNKESNNFFDDEDFQDSLVALLCRDPKLLQDCSHILTPSDFKPLRGMRWGRPRWVVAEQALSYYQKYHEPPGRLLKAHVLEYIHSIGMADRQVQEIRDYLKFLRVLKPESPAAISDKVIHYKRQRLKAQTIQEMVNLQSSGELTDEKWYELSRKAVSTFEHQEHLSTDYFENLANRMERRRLHNSSSNHLPVLFIDPLDSLIRKMLGPGQFGTVLAPPKRGKSLFLEWIALAYVIQHLNVLYFTLEDPQSEVEDRFDAAVTRVPIHRLSEKPSTVQRRFRQYRRIVRSKLRIVDGTQGGVSVPRIEQIMLRERESGFMPDALIVDYDDEIVPTAKHKERRFEFADIYRDLRQLAARYQLIVWTAAQTQRGTESLKILSGDRLAEDYSKIRKVTVALGLGQGDWCPDSIYLYVAGHKHDIQHVGCHIVPDKSRMIIYDREKTKEWEMKQEETDADSGIPTT